MKPENNPHFIPGGQPTPREQALINDAARAVEEFGEDELERFAATFDPDCEDCAMARDGEETEKCPSSERRCGHHCNHSWSQTSCCWCKKEWDEGG